MHTQTQNKSYTVNREGAMQACSNARISEKGKYYGQFTRAEFVISSKGTLGIDFTFKAQDGAIADFLTIWTQRQNGESLSGRNMLDALMTCMRVKSMDVRRARIEKYNTQTKQREMMDAEVYPDLMQKPIGLLMVQEEYLAGDGTIKTKMQIAGCFDAASDKTAKEIWDKSAATALPAIVASLRNKQLPTTTLHSGRALTGISTTGNSRNGGTMASNRAEFDSLGFPGQFDDNMEF